MVHQLLSAYGETDIDLLAQKATDILSVSPANPPTDDKPQYKAMSILISSWEICRTP